MNSMKILIDTNILIYADNKDSNWSNVCNAIIENSLKNKEIQLFIPQKVLLEYYRVSTSKVKNLRVETVIENILFYIENFEILYDNAKTTEIMFEIALETNAKSGKIFDLNILALALQNKIDILYTVNIKNFPNVKGLKILLPNNI